MKRILKDAETNAHLKSKFVGVLANLVQVQDKFETAIEVALGAGLQNIVTQNEENAKELITYLKNHRYGRATFMPITTMKPRSIPAQDEKYLGGVGIYGVASNLLKFAPEISNVVQNLLGNVVIVENLDIATNLARQCGFRFKIVTLEGDVINPSGAMTGGPGMQGMPGGMPDGTTPPDGQEPPEGGERPDGQQPPADGERPDGGEPPERPDGENGGQFPGGFGPNGMQGTQAYSTEFVISGNANMFSGITQN